MAVLGEETMAYEQKEDWEEEPDSPSDAFTISAVHIWGSRGSFHGKPRESVSGGSCIRRNNDNAGFLTWEKEAGLLL